MNSEILKQYTQREDELLLCLQYCAWLTVGVFTTGERILINQERGALFDARSRGSDEPRYQLDGQLAMKVEKLIGELRFTKWNSEYLTKQYK